MADLRSSVQSALDKQTSATDTKTDKTDTKDNQTDTKETSESTEDTEETSEETEETTEETTVDSDTEEALALYNALRNPNTREAALENLVKVLKPEGTTKQQTRQLRDFVKEQLGSEFEFLADKLGPVLEQIVNLQNQQFNQKLQEFEARQAQVQFNREYDQFFKANPDAKNYEKQMDELASKLSPGKDISISEYLNLLYKQASSGKTQKQTVKKTIERIKENAKDTSNVSSDVDETRVKQGSRLPTLKEAIALAQQGKKIED